MHIFKLATLTAVFSLLFTHQAFASSYVPTECPSVKKIQAKAAMQAAALIPQDIMDCTAQGHCTYDVNAPIYTISDNSRTAWYFTMALEDQKVVSEAKLTVKAALQTLRLVDGPTLAKAGEYQCHYTDNYNIDGTATYYFH
jgi:hypothetical protein